jgi:hypothetical protein
VKVVKALALCLFLLGSLGPGRLLAQDAVRSPMLESGRRGHLSTGGAEPLAAWADVSLFSGPIGPTPDSYTVLGTQLGLRMGIEREARLSVDWGFAYTLAHVAGSIATATRTIDYDAELERVEAQNPLLSFDWLPFVGTNARVGLGLSLAIPAAAVQRFGDRNQAGPTNPTDAAIFVASRTLHGLWMAMNGAWAAYRYQPERLALAVPLSASFDLGSVGLAFDGTLGLSVPVLGGQGVVDGIAALAAEIWGQPATFGGGGLSLGLRASITGYHLGAGSGVPEEVRDGGQPAAEPWIRLDLRPAHLVLRAVVNLGGAYGVGTENGVWAVHLGGGIAVD